MTIALLHLLSLALRLRGETEGAATNVRFFPAGRHPSKAIVALRRRRERP
jgi:hypothetical protein